MPQRPAWAPAIATGNHKRTATASKAAASEKTTVKRLRAPARELAAAAPLPLPLTPTGLAEPWMAAYLEQLATNGGQKIAAAKSVDIAYVTVFRHRQRDSAFEQAEAAAMKHAMDVAESEARRRAIEGVESLYTTKGGTIHTERKYSDSILLRLLERLETGSWRQKQQIEHSGGMTFKTRAERKEALEKARAALTQQPVEALNGRS